MDRVSSLPDELLCHILSLLTTKEAALTSALSKRWVDLWTRIPNLDIDDTVFLHPEEGKGEREEIRQSFVEFVDRVLASQGDSPIKKFSLKCITGVHPDCVNRWIRNVVQRGVSNLNLFIDFTWEDIEDGYHLPQEMFVSKTLVELKIRSERSVDWWSGGEENFLPMLKVLDIDSEMIHLNEKMDSFLPCFPVLEEFELAITEWSDLDDTVYETLSSASLKKLNIHINYSLDPVYPKSISFDTPSLLYFNYSDFAAEDYPVVNMKALFDAQINLMLTDDEAERVRTQDNDLLEYDGVNRYGNVVKLINGIRNVEQLSFTADTMEVLSLCCETMPVFNNVRSLIVKSEEDRGWEAMPVLLKNCPNLKVLIMEGLLHKVTDQCGDACNCISQEDEEDEEEVDEEDESGLLAYVLTNKGLRHKVTDTCGDVCDCISREEKGRSLRSCPVKKIEIHGFRGTMREINMIRHFLDYFPCLKEIEIITEDVGFPTQLEVTDVAELKAQLMELHDKSLSCNVFIGVCESLYMKLTAI